MTLPGFVLLLPLFVTDQRATGALLSLTCKKPRRFREVTPQHLANGPRIAEQKVRGMRFRTAIKMDGFEYLHLIESRSSNDHSDPRRVGTWLRVKRETKGSLIIGVEEHRIEIGTTDRIQIEMQTIPEEN